MVESYEIMARETYDSYRETLAGAQGSASHHAENGEFEAAYEILREAIDEALQTTNYESNVGFHVEDNRFRVPNWEELTE